MPVIRIQDTPDIAPAGPPADYQSASVNPAQFGGAIGQGLQQFGKDAQQGGGDLVQGAIVQQDRFNQIAANDAFNKFQTGADNITYGNPGDPNAPKGLYALRGADALRAGPQAVQSLTTLRNSINDGLQNDAQKLQFAQQSRRFMEIRSGEISRHLDAQSNVYAEEVNKATLDNSVRSASDAYNSDEILMHSIQDGRSSAVKSAQVTAGMNPDPAIIKDSMGRSDSLVIQGAVNGALAHGDYNRASQIMLKFGDMVDPAMREALNQRTKAHSEAGAVAGAAQSVINGGAPAQTPTPASGFDIDRAIHGQESGGAAVSPTSINGAVGGYQIKPDTFAQYARPGEAITNPDDNAAVGRRIIADYTQRYNNDPARVAVAYFSGPGNVAPPGSPTPWVQDKKDGNGTSTSQYVSGVLTKLNSPNHNPAAFTAEQQMIETAKVEAQKQFPDRPDLQNRMVEQVYQHVAQTNVLQAKYEAEQAKALRDAQQAAGDKVVRQLMTDPTKLDVVSDIANNPSLTYEQKWNLYRMSQSVLANGADDKDAKTYGPGFYKLYQQIHAPNDDPARVTDPSALWSHVGPNGDLTVSGVDKLTKEIQSQRTPEGTADGKMQTAALAYAKHQLSFEADLGVIKIRDPKGEDAFNVGFLPAFYKAYDAGLAAGKTPYQLLSKDSPDFIVDKIVGAYKRSPAEQARDMLTENQGYGASLPPAQADTGTAPRSNVPTRAELEAEMRRRGLMPDQAPRPVDAAAAVPH